MSATITNKAAAIITAAARYLLAAGYLAVDADNALVNVARSMRDAAENDGQRNPATFRAWSTAWTAKVRETMFSLVSPETVAEYKSHTDADRDAALLSDECRALHVAMVSAKSRFAKCTRLYKALCDGDATAEAVYAGDLSFYAWTKNAGKAEKTDAPKSDETQAGAETPAPVTIQPKSPRDKMRAAIVDFLASGGTLADVMAIGAECVRESVGAEK